MRKYVLFSSVVILLLISSPVRGDSVDSRQSCLLETLKKTVQTYYSAINAGDTKSMYLIESELYRKEHPLSNYKPDLIESKRANKFDKLSVRTTEFWGTDTAMVIVEFLIFNESDRTWYNNGSFQQSWKCNKGSWFVNGPPAIFFLK